MLKAAREPVPKTRIAGAANLNSIAFQRYMGFCLERGLVDSRSGSYAATPRAIAVVESIDRVIEQSSELERTVNSLHVVETNGGNGIRGSGATLRFVSRWAWRELAAKDAARSGARANDLRSRPVGPDNGHSPADPVAPDSSDRQLSSVTATPKNGGSRPRPKRTARPQRPTGHAR